MWAALSDMFRRMKRDYELAALAAEQAGFLSKEQVEAHGLSSSAIKTRIHNGTWVLVRNGLYQIEGVQGDHRGLLRGAMAILPDATVSHQSAAELHRIPYMKSGIAAVTVHAGTTHDFPGVSVHRSIDLAPHHRMKAGTVLATTPARTFMDLAAVLKPRLLELAFDESLASGLVSIRAVKDVFDDVARRGRTGTGPMRKLLAERLGSDMVSATRLERVGRSVFDSGGLPAPFWQYPAPWDASKRIDFAWPHVYVGCECDSRRWHTRSADFQRDRERDNLSLIHNWRIFRFTWDDFMKRPGIVISQLAMAIG